MAAAYRGQGLARLVVAAALERAAALKRAAALGPEFVILFCHEDRAGLYHKLGFARVAADVQVRQTEGYAPMPLLTVWRALRAGAPWPTGALTVHSLLF